MLNELSNASGLKRIMFADDTNLFCKSKTLKTLFESKYRALKNFGMVSSKQSLNEDKTRFTLFHNLQDRVNLPLQLPVLKINNYKIKRSKFYKISRSHGG